MISFRAESANFPRAVACGAAISALAMSAFAQSLDLNAELQQRGDRQIPVAIEQLDTLHASPNGSWYEPGPGTRGCMTLASHTDANFSGGTFVMQAGFSQGEWLGTTYNVPAGDFPVRVDLIEAIFATSNATVQTTTVWRIAVWEGVPTAGNMIFDITADDLILPYLRIGPGTAGVNLNFAIDPGDPEQIIVQDNGSHQFTIGIQIVSHNQPPANPCQSSPQTCCNAFPTTDTSGLAQSSLNWLMGLNCGAFGCPPNGGWARFSALNVLCRPTGDWVARCTYTPVNCQTGVGPCCILGSCSIRTQTECASLGGTYQGDGTSCAGITCPPPPTQACCFAGGGCLNLSPANCTGAGGTPGGLGTSCATYNCNPTGACCLPNGSCIGPVTPANCASQGGTFQGDGTVCGSVNCPQPSYACCFSNGFCLMLNQADCTTAGGTWNLGETCADNNSNGTADACEAPPACPGDLNGDSVVDIADLTRLLSNFGRTSGASASDGDSDGDGDVDLPDLTFLLAHFGQSC